jgi:hypothetical protein
MACENICLLERTSMATAGYSGTPLAKKLSLRPDQRLWWENVPVEVQAEILGSEIPVQLLLEPESPIEAAHVFIRSRAALEEAVHRLLPLLARDGFLWISWPKRSADKTTDMSEDVARWRFRSASSM